MSTLSKSAVNAKYDQLRAQLKAGTISQSNFKAASDRLYKMYHGKANAATRNKVGQPSTSTKPGGNKPVQTQSRVQQATKSVQQSNKGKERFFAGGKGGKYDKSVKSNKGKQRFFDGGKGGKYDKSGKSGIDKLKMADHPAAPKSSQKTKKPTFKLIKGVLHILKGGKYVPAKKSR